MKKLVIYSSVHVFKVQVLAIFKASYHIWLWREEQFSNQILCLSCSFPASFFIPSFLILYLLPSFNPLLSFFSSTLLDIIIDFLYCLYLWVYPIALKYPLPSWVLCLPDTMTPDQYFTWHKPDFIKGDCMLRILLPGRNTFEALGKEKW